MDLSHRGYFLYCDMCYFFFMYKYTFILSMILLLLLISALISLFCVCPFFFSFDARCTNAQNKFHNYTLSDFMGTLSIASLRFESFGSKYQMSILVCCMWDLRWNLLFACPSSVSWFLVVFLLMFLTHKCHVNLCHS